MKQLFTLLILVVLFGAGCTSTPITTEAPSPPEPDNNQVKTHLTIKDSNNSGGSKESEQSDSQSNKSNSNTMSAETILVTMSTNYGDIKLRLFASDAPKTVDNFVKLAKEGFYDGTLFHRVIPGFMIQGGDPNSKLEDWTTHGMGGPGYTFADEINEHKLIRGTLAMANSGPNTNGSQFFIVTADATSWLDGKHTAFGEVVDGLNVVDQIERVATNGNDHPLEDVIIKGITIEE